MADRSESPEPRHNMVRFAAPLLFLVPGLAFAQGDDCSVATPIATAGVFPFDNTAFTDSGFIGPGAAPCFGSDFDRDMFWAWTSPTTDAYLIHTCAGTTFDTELSVHLGADCSATSWSF